MDESSTSASSPWWVQCVTPIYKPYALAVLGSAIKLTVELPLHDCVPLTVRLFAHTTRAVREAFMRNLFLNLNFLKVLAAPKCSIYQSASDGQIDRGPLFGGASGRPGAT
jgi:hypothetical protein